MVEIRSGEILGDRPRFAIRLPGGTVLRPGQFTVEWLDAQAHTPGMIPGSSAVVDYPNGRLDASFDEYGQLRHIGVRFFGQASDDQAGGRGVAVANPNARSNFHSPPRGISWSRCLENPRWRRNGRSVSEFVDEPPSTRHQRPYEDEIRSVEGRGLERLPFATQAS